MRHPVLAAIGVAVVLAAALTPWSAVRPVAAATLPADCVQSGSAVTCTWLSGDNPFVVPDGVTLIYVTAVGGAGAEVGPSAGSVLSEGGRGAAVSGDIGVTPGSTLHAVVGGSGVGSTGGANGGGPGGTTVSFRTNGDCPGGGGGGASDVRTGSTLASRLLVAAGGGGVGCLLQVRAPLGGEIVARTSGGDAGTNGEPCHGTCPSDSKAFGDGNGGRAGCIPPDVMDETDEFSCSRGGPGGFSPLTGTAIDDVAAAVRQGGDPGSAGAGGAGGIGMNAGGGGGGGGLSGGGGGGGGGYYDSIDNGAGGGGGSSLVPLGGSLAIDTTGVPIITISYAAEAIPPAAPVAAVTPASIDFGSETTGTTSGARVATLSNTGTAPLAVDTAGITGANRTEFAIAVDGCSGRTLAPATACDVAVTFSPSTAATLIATLVFSNDAAGSPHGVALSGTGVEPVVQTADLAVSIAASPNPVKSGQKLTYTITIGNAGPSSARDVLANSILSSQSTFLSATPSQGSCVTPVRGASGTVTCSIGSIAIGATGTIRIVVTATAKRASISNAVTVSTSTNDPNLANNSASIATRVK